MCSPNINEGTPNYRQLKQAILWGNEFLEDACFFMISDNSLLNLTVKKYANINFNYNICKLLV